MIVIVDEDVTQMNPVVRELRIRNFEVTVVDNADDAFSQNEVESGLPGSNLLTESRECQEPVYPGLLEVLSLAPEVQGYQDVSRYNSDRFGRKYMRVGKQLQSHSGTDRLPSGK